MCCMKKCDSVWLSECRHVRVSVDMCEEDKLCCNYDHWLRGYFGACSHPFRGMSNAFERAPKCHFSFDPNYCPYHLWWFKNTFPVCCIPLCSIYRTTNGYLTTKTVVHTVFRKNNLNNIKWDENYIFESRAKQKNCSWWILGETVT